MQKSQSADPYHAFPASFPILFSVALSSFSLFQLITYLEVPSYFGATGKMAPYISQYPHRKTHNLHQAWKRTVPPKIKVYVMPVFSQSCETGKIFLSCSASAQKSLEAFVGFNMLID